MKGTASRRMRALVLACLAVFASAAPPWDTLLPGVNVDDVLGNDPNLVERFSLPAELKFPGASCDQVLNSVLQDVFKGVFKGILAPALGLEPKNLRLKRVTCDADSIEASLELVADNLLTNEQLQRAVDRLQNLTALTDQLPAAFKNAYKISRTEVLKLWEDAQDWPEMINLPAFLPFNTTFWTETVPHSIAQVIAEGARLAVPLRITLPDADCRAIVKEGVADVTDESEFKAFVAAVQDLAAKGLGVPRTRINITNVVCGSIVTEFTWLTDGTITNDQVTAALNRLTTDPTAFFPLAFTAGFNASTVRAEAVQALDSLPGWGTTTLPDTPVPAFNGSVEYRIPLQLTLDTLSAGCAAALGSAQAEAGFRAGLQGLLAAAAIVPAERLAITRVQCNTTADGAQLVVDYEFLVPGPVNNAEVSRVLGVLTSPLTDTPLTALFKSSYGVQTVRSTADPATFPPGVTADKPGAAGHTRVSGWSMAGSALLAGALLLAATL